MSLKCRFFGAIVRALDKVANSGAGDLGAVGLGKSWYWSACNAVQMCYNGY